MLLVACSASRWLKRSALPFRSRRQYLAFQQVALPYVRNQLPVAATCRRRILGSAHLATAAGHQNLAMVATSNGRAEIGVPAARTQLPSQ